MPNSVAKVIEISAGSTKSFDDAVQSGLKKVAKSVKNIGGAWIKDFKVRTSADGKVTSWRVIMQVSFIVE